MPHFEVKLIKIKKFKIRTDLVNTTAAWVVHKTDTGRTTGQFIFKGLHYFTSEQDIKEHLKLRNAHARRFIATLKPTDQ